MTPADLKAARKSLDLTQAELASMLRMRGEHAPDTVRKWERGALDIPGYVIVIIDLAVNVPGARERLVTAPIHRP
jgi:DNA-binding transcriptional regulator YiaG